MCGDVSTQASTQNTSRNRSSFTIWSGGTAATIRPSCKTVSSSQEHGCVVEVVQRDNAGNRQAGDEPHEVNLVLNIEMVGRFIEDQLSRRLCRRPCNMGALLFAARQALLSFRLPTMPARSSASSTARSSTSIAREEIFGPVLSIMPYQDDEEAIAIANDTVYRLGAHVQSSDQERARRVAARIRAGQVHINYPAWDGAAAFGGYKRSGNGRQYGVHGL